MSILPITELSWTGFPAVTLLPRRTESPAVPSTSLGNDLNQSKGVRRSVAEAWEGRRPSQVGSFLCERSDSGADQGRLFLASTGFFKDVHPPLVTSGDLSHSGVS